MINLAVLIHWKKKKLRLYRTASHTLNEEELVMSQNNEEMKTDLLHMTSVITPRMSLDEMQGTSNTRKNTLVTEEFPLMNSVANQKDEIFTGTQTQEFERKDRMSSKVIDEQRSEFTFLKIPTWIHLHKASQLLFL